MWPWEDMSTVHIMPNPPFTCTVGIDVMILSLLKQTYIDKLMIVSCKDDSRNLKQKGLRALASTKVFQVSFFSND